MLKDKNQNFVKIKKESRHQKSRNVQNPKTILDQLKTSIDKEYDHEDTQKIQHYNLLLNMTDQLSQALSSYRGKTVCDASSLTHRLEQQSSLTHGYEKSSETYIERAERHPYDASPGTNRKDLERTHEAEMLE